MSNSTTEVKNDGQSNAPRVFDSGASRNSDNGKLDFEGFLCPLVLKRYAEFMHKHRHLEDGSLRDSDNWQKGIPRAQLVKSLLRHTNDVWLHERGFGEAAEESIESALCGVIFNAMGYLRSRIMLPALNVFEEHVAAEAEAGDLVRGNLGEEGYRDLQ